MTQVISIIIFTMTVDYWSDGWERLMARYQPGREQAIERMLELIETRCEGRAPRVLDVGGGTGTLCRRLLERLPQAEATLVDLDPVMLTIAGASLPPAVEVVRADLRDAGWTALLRTGYDVVLSVMALHYLPPGRLTELYAELSRLVRPGGFLANVDDMPDTDAVPPVRNHEVPGDGEAYWAEWWKEVASDPVLGPAAVERARLFGAAPSAEWNPPAAWHLRALGAASFDEVGVAWRDGGQAAVLAFRSR